MSSKRRRVSPALREGSEGELRSRAGEGAVEVEVETLRVADVKITVGLGRETTAEKTVCALLVRCDVFGGVFGGLQVATGEKGRERPTLR